MLDTLGPPRRASRMERWIGWLVVALLGALLVAAVAVIWIGKAALCAAVALFAAVLIAGVMKLLLAAFPPSGTNSRSGRIPSCLRPESAPLAVGLFLSFLAGEPLDELRDRIGCSPERFDSRFRAGARFVSAVVERTPGLATASVIETWVRARHAGMPSGQLAQDEDPRGVEPPGPRRNRFWIGRLAGS